MKKLFVVMMLALAFGSCKKAVENAKEDLVIKAMTDGHWGVTSFILNGTDITADFTNYKFKYYSNKTVDAIKSGIVEKTGAWDGDANAMTTWASFSSPAYPLSLINGTWQITRNSWTYVEATQAIAGGDTKVMRLDKL